MKWIIFSSLFILGTVWTQDLLENIPNLPDLNVNELETAAAEKYAKDALAILKQKCANTTGGDEVYTELESRANALKTFITDNINFTNVMTELEEAKKTGSMDEVFAKYCARKPEAIDRMRNITNTFKKCLLPEEQKSIELKLNLTEKMINFLCEKDGDKIAMFIASGGEECLSSKVDGIQGCFNKSSEMFPSTNWETVSLLEVDEKICEGYPVLESCVVTVLEECKAKTPANIIGAMFKYLRLNMDCAPQKEPINAPNERKLDGLVELNRLKRATSNFVQDRFLTKCRRNDPGNPNAYNNLNASFNAFAGTLFNNVFRANDVCPVLKRNTEIQTDEFLVYFKKCLSTKEGFIPNFVRSSVEGIFEYLCENDARKLRAYRNAMGLQCVMTRETESFSNCSKRITGHTTDGGEVVLQQSDFQNDVIAMKKCVQKDLLDGCNYDRSFRKISEDLLDIISDRSRGSGLSGGSGSFLFVNNFLLCMLIYNIYKYL